jgi:hypothetical protein
MIWSLQILRFIVALMIVYTHAASIALAATGSIHTAGLRSGSPGKASTKWEVSGDGSAELLDDGSIEIEFAYHNGDDALLKAKRDTSTAC